MPHAPHAVHLRADPARGDADAPSAVLHQLEDRKPTNAGRLAARCLAESAVSTRAVPPATLWEGTEPVLVFPHAEARPLESCATARGRSRWSCPTAPGARPTRLAVDPGLDALPCATLPPVVRFSYRLAMTVGRIASTIEAVALALRNPRGAGGGRTAGPIFRIMVDRDVWTNGRIASASPCGIPSGVRSHDPLGTRRAREAPRPRRSSFVLVLVAVG